MTRILITSALPYINGIKHLGTLAGSMLPADVFARFQRSLGRETLYICATDEHGTPTELAAAEAGLDPATVDAASGPRKVGPGRTRGRPKGTGTRANEALALVKATPGITIPQIAAKMGIKQNYLYRVLPSLETDGLVEKDGRGWRPKAVA